MEGREFIGIEREGEYLEIARRRIEAAAAQERLPV
jgi:DNA modification methylase